MGRLTEAYYAVTSSPEDFQNAKSKGWFSRIEVSNDTVRKLRRENRKK